MSFMQLMANTRAGNAHSKQGATITTTRQALVTAHEHVIFVRRNARCLNLTSALVPTLQPYRSAVACSGDMTCFVLES